MLVIVMVVLNVCAQLSWRDQRIQSDIEAIERQARRYEAALAVGDIETCQSLYTEDCRGFPTGAPPYIGRESNYLY